MLFFYPGPFKCLRRHPRDHPAKKLQQQQQKEGLRAHRGHRVKKSASVHQDLELLLAFDLALKERGTDRRIQEKIRLQLSKRRFLCDENIILAVCLL